MRVSRSVVKPILSLLLTLGLAAPAHPGPAPTATLSGRIVGAADARPMPGARVWLAESPGTRVIASSPSSQNGAFRLRQVPPGTYALAVETGPGLYTLEPSLQLTPDATHVVRIEVPFGTTEDSAANEAPSPSKAQKRIWNNPYTASLIVLGAAALVSVVVQSVTDETLATPTATD
jgi:hypothetical protein